MEQGNILRVCTYINRHHNTSSATQTFLTQANTKYGNIKYLNVLLKPLTHNILLNKKENGNMSLETCNVMKPVEALVNAVKIQEYVTKEVME